MSPFSAPSQIHQAHRSSSVRPSRDISKTCVEHHRTNNVPPALNLVHTGFAGVWTPATHSGGVETTTGPYTCIYTESLVEANEFRGHHQWRMDPSHTILPSLKNNDRTIYNIYTESRLPSVAMIGIVADLGRRHVHPQQVVISSRSECVWVASCDWPRLIILGPVGLCI